MMGVMVGIVAMTWSISADREHRDRMPEVRLASGSKSQIKAESKNGILKAQCEPKGCQNEADRMRSHIDFSRADTGHGRSSSTRRHRRREKARHDAGDPFGAALGDSVRAL